MKLIRGLAQYYVDLMMKLGLVRFSILLASALVILAMAMQMAVTFVLHGEVQGIDLIRSIFFGLLITPWAVYFLSIVVEQLEESRQRLSSLVAKLEEMRQRDAKLNLQLKENIDQLNQEISDREKAEKAHLVLLDKLKLEMEQREKTQIELEQQSVLLRSFLDASPDLVYYRNEDNEFSGCNRAMELLTGKSEKQLIGLTPTDVYDKEIASKVMETDEKVFRHNVSLTYEQWLVYPDGRKACFELRKVPFYDRVGKRHGLMGFGRDITERKRYQDALENASRDKTTFISTISHELRTPLNGIVGLSRILMDTDLTPEQCKYLETIHVSAITLGNIFNDIIELDKIERRKVQLDNQPVDFTGFMTDLENISALLAQPKGIKFVLEPELPLPAKVLTDGTRLRQILWNLISNAVKFTPEGEIKVRIWREEEEERLFFEVTDSGIGIPPDELEKIFAMYYQVKDSAGGRPATGTGIGLAVSKRLALSMGGDIVVNSTLGKGSCFTLSVVAPAIAEQPAGKAEQETLPLPVLNILLVEDIELNVIVARSVLEKLGNSVDVAMNGRDALAMFDPDEYDLVLLDIQLPDMTGLDIARQLHQRYSSHSLPPLIALTANVLKDKKEYLDAGMDDVLNKPLSVKALTAVIEKYWGKGSESDTALVGVDLVSQDEERLDTEMLNQYIELVGPKMITDNLVIFETMMPNYLALLDSNMTAKDQKGITEEAHKIKGAAGSVGLRHLQQLAQQIQSPDLPAWWDNVQEWVDELKLEWKQDIEILRNWLSSGTKK
ncbi:aerobic respiration two-component sensor histidine kinase ArcB [Xenorhabdus griffiniae]|uniref:Aerobic respiration control sensor protein n=1 Tax=Xenorhabdus griffiniae TaxID=351672 RepID=A0ABY9XJ36_9GAMM|nr:aerobic respiration two-component sensor histidine kinase ArcB [Xenorhabdus griffiniae]MBD1226793.1 aerobic respiration two-component sensor histidine kinase ArcB [Xenorhabdus griffiniae]MBE8586798.1 aerobic respiration two-component sensor histidine kinase ArcB [Xenorhabdus griffiniae]WMV72949.1 aerobic respiration two-component sensor histidine kinase ArcB [Xenorhabdus griffiniae]WNH02628.1 aerobic respiration two-component sensor histidine kinase ArcB [Xenorhabdus griffiniae]